MEPCSPSVFLDLPPAPSWVVDADGSSSGHQDNDLVLPYISRMLMEEDDIADKQLYSHLDDDSALLKTEQTFAEIISNAINPSRPCSTTSTSVELLQDTESMVQANGFLPAESICADAVSMAFFRGVEEANKLLPPITDSDSRGQVVVHGSSRKKRHEQEAETSGAVDRSGRSSKQKATPPLSPESEEEATAREMLDRLMLDGYDPSSLLAADTHQLFHHRVARKPRGTGWRRSGSRQAVDMHNLLIRCAEAMSANDWRGAAGLLELIKHNSSPTGNGMQRLAHCFAKGLEARLAGTESQIYQSLVAKRASTVGKLKAYQLFMSSCCFLPVQLLFSNKTIYKAVAGRKKLHIVVYGLGHGVQWPDLLRWLSRREGGPPEVRLTGIDKPQPGFHLAWHVEETGRRLSACARQFGVPFVFRGIARSEAIHVEDLDIDTDEVLVVNSMLHLETLMDESITVERPNPRDVVLGTITKMRPSVFVHTVANGPHSGAFFMPRFHDALQRYTALFDMMDTIAPRDDDKRLLVEQEVLARSVTSTIACEGVERAERPQNYKQWQARNRRAGLRQLPLDSEIVEALKGKVSKEYHKCFMISEDQL